MNKPEEVRFWEKVDKSEDCWVWQACRLSRGYGLFRSKNGKRVQAHRYSRASVNGTIPVGMFVCHHCDNPPCVNPEHLFLGTALDNRADCVAKGRQARGPASANKKVARGTKNGRAVLTEDNVHRMRVMYAAGWSLRKIARSFNLTSHSHVGRIVRRTRWAHVA